MIPVFITVRTASTRLPNKCLLPLGDCKVIEHVIRRCKHAEFRPIVCTTTNDEDTILEHIASIEDVEVFCGDIDPHKRWIQCAEANDIWSFHALDCDDPYFCPKEVERSYSYMNDLKLHCVMPTESSSEGMATVGTSLSRRKGETRILPEIRKIPHIRMTLDYEEDYQFFLALNRLGAGYMTSREDIEELASEPLYKINEFRNSDWKLNQEKRKNSCMKFGIIQGRLTQSKELQSFPEDWVAEFIIAKEIGLDFIELIVERTHNPKNPVWIAKSDFPYSCPIICDDHIISNGIDIDYTRRLIDQCHWFDCSKIVMPLFEAAETLPPDKISPIMDYAALKGVSIIFESNANDGLYPIAYDTGNRAWAGFNNRDDILTFNEKISHVHIKDKNADGANVFLGTGLVDFHEVALALNSIGYDGTMTFESVRGHDPVKTAKHNIEFIKFFINECN